LRRTASFDVLSVKIGLTDSPVDKFKNQKSVVNFEPRWGAKNPGRIEANFFWF